jgi:hypothetical protein
MPITFFRTFFGTDDDDGRVDGRELDGPAEPGSDDLLLRGLLLAFARRSLERPAGIADE